MDNTCTIKHASVHLVYIVWHILPAYNNYSELTGQSSLDAVTESTRKQGDTLPQTNKQQDGETTVSLFVLWKWYIHACILQMMMTLLLERWIQVKMKKVNPFMLVYNFTYYVYLWYSALCITLKGVYWAIASQNQFSVWQYFHNGWFSWHQPLWWSCNSGQTVSVS